MLGHDVQGSPFPSLLLPEDNKLHGSLSKGKLMDVAKASIEAGNDVHLSLSHDRKQAKTITEMLSNIKEKDTKEKSSKGKMNSKSYIKEHGSGHVSAVKGTNTHVYRQSGIAFTYTHTYKGNSKFFSHYEKLTILKLAGSKKFGIDLMSCSIYGAGEYSIRAVCGDCGKPLNIISTAERMESTNVDVVVMPGDLDVQKSHYLPMNTESNKECKH